MRLALLCSTRTLDLAEEHASISMRFVRFPRPIERSKHFVENKTYRM